MSLTQNTESQQQQNAMLCDQPEQKDIVNIVMKQVDDVLKTGGQAESTGNEKKGLNSEMTREKEREQEQQKQKQPTETIKNIIILKMLIRFRLERTPSLIFHPMLMIIKKER